MIILDGAMGTQLQAAGIQPGEKPEIFGMEHPEVVRAIHRRYIEAGSRVIYANTFGASAPKMAGTGVSPREAILANVRTAKEAAAETPGVRVALDMGPIGELLEPMGALTFEEAYDIYKEQVLAGVEAGCDLVVCETLTDLYEAKAALLAVRENADLPAWVTLTFEANGRTFLGTRVDAMAQTLEGLGASAIGVNCSLGPAELLPIVREMAQWTSLPLIVKPNAGLPDPRTGEYAMDSGEFAREMAAYKEVGIAAAGGCCGSDPSFIEALAGVMRDVPDWTPADRTEEKRRGICSASSMAEFGKVNVIGERINPTGKKRLQQALQDQDMDYVKQLAIEQEEAGADILDINVGTNGVDEKTLIVKVVKAVQSVTTLPLQIDSADPEVVEAGLRAVNGRAIINSVNGDQARMDAIFPLARHYGAALLGLCLDETGLPDTAEQRIEIAGRILKESEKYQIPREDIIIDCLTLTVSAQQNQAVETLKAVRYMSETLGQHCALGVSNISFGLPAKLHVTENFLIQALQCGLDFPIINPNEKFIYDAVVSFRALSCEDPDCAAYIQRFAPEEAARKRLKKAGKKLPPFGALVPEDVPEASGAGEKESSAGDPLQDAIIKGLPGDVERLTRELLSTTAGMDIIQQKIIPALDVVGDRYEKEIIFLPQLINAANAATAGLDLIKAKMIEEGGSGAAKGKIILATVQGDIHDIGKNIVKVVLENYGYQIYDLGRDVAPEAVVACAQENQVKLVGLSSLMTTTVPAMQKTIEALKEAGTGCVVMVGGAVLTPEYAEEIGADYYSKDAQQSVEIARKVLG